MQFHGKLFSNIVKIFVKFKSLFQFQVSRSLSSNEIIMMQQQQHLRSSLRKTMVNTQFGYFDQSEDQDSRATLQQSSPDSQYGEGCDNNSGSLSVMRRREPLGASGNKPERPK